MNEELFSGKCDGYQRECDATVEVTWEGAGAKLILCEDCDRRLKRHNRAAAEHYHAIELREGVKQWFGHKPDAIVIDNAWYTRQAARNWMKRQDFPYNAEPFIIVRCKWKRCAWQNRELDGRARTNGVAAGG